VLKKKEEEEKEEEENFNSCNLKDLCTFVRLILIYNTVSYYC